MDRQSIGVVLGLLAFVWVLQIILSSLQGRRFHLAVSRQRKLGDPQGTAVGMAGSNWRGKVYGVLTTDAERRIVAAGRLSGVTVFANIKPVPEVVGLTLDDIENGEPPAEVKKKLWQAFQHSAGFIRRQDERQAEADANLAAQEAAESGQQKDTHAAESDGAGTREQEPAADEARA